MDSKKTPVDNHRKRTRSAGALQRRVTKRLDIQLEGYRRKCDCPPWTSCKSGCSKKVDLTGTCSQSVPSKQEPESPKEELSSSRPTELKSAAGEPVLTDTASKHRLSAVTLREKLIKIKHEIADITRERDGTDGGSEHVGQEGRQEGGKRTELPKSKEGRSDSSTTNSKNVKAKLVAAEQSKDQRDGRTSQRARSRTRVSAKLSKRQSRERQSPRATPKGKRGASRSRRRTSDGGDHGSQACGSSGGARDRRSVRSPTPSRKQRA